MLKALTALYAVAVAALAITAVLALSLRCEGFGCTGIGVVWVTWAGAFIVVLIWGALLHLNSTLGARLSRLLRWSNWVQAAMGCVLIAIWLSRVST